MPTDLEQHFGLRLRGGLPESNGLAPLAEGLIRDTSQITYLVASVRCAAVTHNTENDSKTASMKLLSLEADLIEEEIRAIQIILDRARVRRTGEASLFEQSERAAEPDSVVELVQPAAGTRRPRRGKS